MVSIKQLSAVLGFCFLIFARTAAAASSDVSIEGTQVHLPIPAGYCVLDSRYSADRAMFGTLNAMTQQQNVRPPLVLAIYMKCDALDMIRDGKQPDVSSLTQYGMYTTPQPIIHTTETREEFLILAEEGVKNEFRKVNPQIVQMMRSYAPGIPPSNVKDGVIRRDELAVYGGGVIEFGNDVIEAGVNAITLIKGVPIWCYVYDRIVDSSSFEGLVGRTRLVIADLIATN